MSDAPMEMPSFPRPLPKIEGDAAPFWQALNQGRIELQRCGACERWVFYPRPFCPSCLSRDVRWTEVAGTGRVYTFSVVRKPTNPYFFGEAPYVYAVVTLDAGVRLPTMLVECDPEKVAIDDPVEAVFARASDEVTLLHFRPRK